MRSRMALKSPIVDSPAAMSCARASGASSTTDTNINFSAEFIIGKSAQLETTLGTGNLKLKTENSLIHNDRVKLVTGGAISGAGAYGNLTANDLVSQIIVSENARIFAAGTLELEATGVGQTNLQSYSETFGAATVAIGTATTIVTPIQQILFKAGSNTQAEGNIYVSAGSNKDLVLPNQSYSSRVDNFAGSAIPISDLKTVALYEADNRVHIQSGARLEGFANIDLNADGWGDVGVTGVAKATNWTSAVASALGGGNDLATFLEIGRAHV